MNIENATVEILIRELKKRLKEGYKYIQSLPKDCMEQIQALRAVRLPSKCLRLLEGCEEGEKDATLSYVKTMLIQERNKLLKEAQLST